MNFTPLNRGHETELEQFLALRDWPFHRRKWLYLIDQGHIFGVFKDQLLIATGGLHLWPGKVAVVTLVVVHPDYTRQGLGRAVTQRAVEMAGGVPCYLYSTDEGHPLYQSLGFETVGYSSIYRGRVEPQSSSDISDGTIEDLLPLDREAYAADRQPFLRDLLQRAVACKVHPHGFAICFEEASFLAVGPVVARDPETARRLVAAAAGGQEVTLCVARPELGTWLGEQGVDLLETPPLQVERGAVIPGRRELIYGIAGHAYG